MPDFKFDYTRYKTPGITIEQLDSMAAAFFNPNGTTGWVTIIWAAIKLIVALAYIWARFKLVDTQLEIEKQQYEVARANSNKTEVDQEPAPITRPQGS